MKNLWITVSEWFCKLFKELKRDVRLIFEILGFVISFIALSLAYVQSMAEKEEVAYRKLADSYVEVLKLGMDDYKLDCYDIPNTTIYPLTPAQKHKQTVIYTILINHFEQAFQLIKDDPDLWNGWEVYFKNYFQREAFLKVYLSIETEWSYSFRAYAKTYLINELVNEGKLPKKYYRK